MANGRSITTILACILYGGPHVVLFAQQSVAVASTGAPASLTASIPQVSQASQTQMPHYKVRDQDVLVISFPNTPEFDQTAMVQSDGSINLTGGTLYVEGETVPQITEQVRQAYASILKAGFFVGVDLKDSQKPLFTVLGQVARPGQYVLRNNVTVAEALSVAGGLIPTARTQLLFYHKESDAWFRVEKFNLKDVLNGQKLKQDVLVRPGDMIFVPEKFIANFRKYVPYSLNAATYSSQSVY